MDNNCLISKLTGRWIVQSANYSLLRSTDCTKLFLSQIQWIYLEDCSLYFKSVIDDLNIQCNIKHIDLYRIESKTSQDLYSVHYIMLAHEGAELSSIIKLDQDFVVLNRFTAHYESSNQLIVTSSSNNMNIVEKIYFLNQNLKVIKSTVKRYNSYIGTSFSSEIRIG